MLKKLLLYLPRYDCVTFQTFLDVLRAAAKDQKHPSLWMLTSAGDSVFTAAKERVYRIVPLSPSETSSFNGPTITDTKPGSGSVTYGLKVVLEPNPKWSLLSDMLDEVEEALGCAAIRESDARLHAQQATRPGASVLVLTRDDRTSNCLQQYLTGDQALSVRQEFYRFVFTVVLLLPVKSVVCSTCRVVGRFVVKHYVRTQSLKALTTSSTSVRVQPETRLLWKLAEEMGNSSSFESMDAFAPVPDQFTQSVVPACACTPRKIPLKVFTASVDGTGLLSGTLSGSGAGGDVSDEFRSRMAAKRPLKKSKTVPSVISGERRAVDSDDEDFVRSETAKSAPAAISFTALTQDPSLGDCPMTFEDWRSARQHTVVSSQAACCDAGVPLLQQLKPNFIILYDPEPELVQEIEVYRNYHAPGVLLRVYVLVHAGSADHMRYLHFLKAEKEVRYLASLRLWRGPIWGMLSCSAFYFRLLRSWYL